MYSNEAIFLKLCSIDGIARNHSSVSGVVSISASVVIIILSLVAVAGNTLILAAVWKNPSLRTPSYILLCGLAFTDLCTGLITQPFYVTHELICLQEPQEIQDRLSSSSLFHGCFCKLWHILQWHDCISDNTDVH